MFTDSGSSLGSRISSEKRRMLTFQDSGSSLGSSIPPEVLNEFLSRLGEDYIRLATRARGGQQPRISRRLERRVGEAGSGGLGSLLKTCSLVCRSWASRCRYYMFNDVVMNICSPEDMESFTHIAFYSSISLTAVHRLIRGLNITQSYNSVKSFCHSVGPLIPWASLEELCLVGPVPDHIPSWRLDTPH